MMEFNIFGEFASSQMGRKGRVLIVWVNLLRRCLASLILMLFMAFNAEAIANGPQFEPGLQVGTLRDYRLDEVSGIAASRQNDDVFWVHNDWGDLPRVYAMNRQGTHLGIYNLNIDLDLLYPPGSRPMDWEDIAIGPGPVNGVDYLYVGDVGDNDPSGRSHIIVYRVAEPAVDSQQSPITTTLNGVDAIRLVYPDGPRNCEALMVDPVTKDIYVISKESGIGRVYRAPYPQSTTTATTM